ncbi:hypothetical protein ABZS95_14165 [Streptomyces sp. NPDC005479]|uniref:hypothetical protein n=1 Tax=Streptomyces sp. NPDC005479 TaxID=3154879 RepID=UPI0033A09ABA
MPVLGAGDFICFAGCSLCRHKATPEGEKAAFIGFEVMAGPLGQRGRMALQGRSAAQSGRIPLRPQASLPAAPGGKPHGRITPSATALPLWKSAGNTLGLLGQAHLPALLLCTTGREGVAA